MSIPAGIEQPDFEPGCITVEWRTPPPGLVMAGWTFRIRDEAGEYVNTVSDMTLHVSAEGGVWAELDMFTDPDGRPAQAPRQSQPSTSAMTGNCSTASSATRWRG